ncbi:MAG: SDR family NAD(P)-dependent oxidoreductase [Sphingomonadaceae bacterium]|nr:SDR family NAD(P)-dependent oxidoreductase [Sphingomonadaceae bacterium]
MKRVLVIGGYGGFGAKIVRLAAREGFHVIVAGRNLAKAAAFCADADKSRFEPLALDRETLTAADIAETGAWAVVDAAGPWQGYDYRLPRA